MTTKANLLKTIRAKCLDCSCYQPSEVAHCPCTACDLWPFRFGRDPTPARMLASKNLAPVDAVLEEQPKNIALQPSTADKGGSQ
jgi:hypothetical protein